MAAVPALQQGQVSWAWASNEVTEKIKQMAMPPKFSCEAGDNTQSVQDLAAAS